MIFNVCSQWNLWRSINTISDDIWYDIDDNSTINFNETTSDDVRANVMVLRKLLTIFGKRFEAEYIIALREKHIKIIGDTFLIKEESTPWNDAKIKLSS